MNFIVLISFSLSLPVIDPFILSNKRRTQEIYTISQRTNPIVMYISILYTLFLLYLLTPNFLEDITVLRYNVNLHHCIIKIHLTFFNTYSIRDLVGEFWLICLSISFLMLSILFMFVQVDWILFGPFLLCLFVCFHLSLLFIPWLFYPLDLGLYSY